MYDIFDCNMNMIVLKYFYDCKYYLFFDTFTFYAAGVQFMLVTMCLLFGRFNFLM